MTTVRSATVATARTNLAWDTLLDLGDARTGPLHDRLTRALRSAIRSGRIAPGSALPPSRTLATSLGCSRWVVTQAYEQLVAEGYLTARTGSATRVAEVGAAPDDRSPIQRQPRVPASTQYDLAPGLPDLREFPRQRWAEAVRTQLTTVPYADLGYPEPGGSQRLREMLTEYLQRVRGAVLAASDITICTSVTDGVARLCRALLAAGHTHLAVEDPGWTRLRQTVERVGLTTVGIRVDDLGFRVEDLASQPSVRAALLTPAHQFPTGVVLAPARRAALLEWARRVDGIVLEDDYDAEFRYDRRPVGALQGAEPSRVALFGSLSKTLSPALGLGWMVTPARWSEAMRSPELGGPSPSALDQLAFAAFVESGGYDRFLRASRTRYRKRRDVLVEALAAKLPDCELSGVAAGLHLVLRLDPARTVAAKVVRRAAHAGVHVVDLDAYRLEPDPESPGLVLGYGNLPDSAIEPAVDRLAAAID